MSEPITKTLLDRRRLLISSMELWIAESSDLNESINPVRERLRTISRSLASARDYLRHIDAILDREGYETESLTKVP